MKYLDFLYYLSYKFYRGFNENGAESTASAIIGGLLSLNAQSIYIVVLLLLRPKFDLDVTIVLILFFIFQIITIIRYHYLKNYSIEVIEKEWLQLNDFRRKVLRSALIGYIIISIFSFLIIVIFGNNFY